MYPALEMIFVGRQLNLVISPIVSSVIDVVIVDRTPEVRRPGPLNVDRLVGLAS